MKFRPLHDRVVLTRIDADEKTAGGIIIPDTAKEKPQGHCPGSIVRFANWHRQIFLDSGILFRFKDS